MFSAANAAAAMASAKKMYGSAAAKAKEKTAKAREVRSDFG